MLFFIVLITLETDENEIFGISSSTIDHFNRHPFVVRNKLDEQWRSEMLRSIEDKSIAIHLFSTHNNLRSVRDQRCCRLFLTIVWLTLDNEKSIRWCACIRSWMNNNRHQWCYSSWWDCFGWRQDDVVLSILADDFVGVRQTIYFHTLVVPRETLWLFLFTSRRRKFVDTRKECYQPVLMVDRCVRLRPVLFFT